MFSCVSLIEDEWHTYAHTHTQTHICSSTQDHKIIIGSDNGLSSVRRQAEPWRHAVIWTNAGLLLIGPLSLVLGLQGLYSATNCADSILGRFTIILQNQIARVDSFTNLTKRWVFRLRSNASISSHNLISFGKQFYARGPYRHYECTLAESIVFHWIL